MRIMFFTISMHQGGAERQVYESAKLLDRKGHEVSVVLFDASDPFYEFESNSITITELDKTSKTSRRKSLATAIEETSPDVVVSFLERENMYLGLYGLSKKSNVPLLIGSERINRPIYFSSVKWRFLMKMAYKGLHAVITNSEETAGVISEKLHFPAYRIYILRNLLDTDCFSPGSPERDLAEQYPQCKGKMTFLVPARISKQKNQKILVSVSKELIAGGVNNFCFILAGNDSGAYAEELKKSIELEGLIDYFVLAGTVGNMPEMYKMSDFTVLPSIAEGFPNVVIESMACGRIPIATDVSDVKSIIADGKNGLVVEKESSAAIARSIVRLLSLKSESRKEMETQARESAMEYGSENYYRNFMNIIHKLKEN